MHCPHFFSILISQLLQQLLLTHLHIHLFQLPSLINQVSILLLVLLVLVNEYHEYNDEYHCKESKDHNVDVIDIIGSVISLICYHEFSILLDNSSAIHWSREVGIVNDEEILLVSVIEDHEGWIIVGVVIDSVDCLVSIL